MQQRARETRQKILTAGIDEFAGHGFHGAKIDVIADQAGVNKQRIYAYFGNKEGLFDAALSSSFERLHQYENVLLRIQPDQADELSERLLRHYMNFHQQYPQFWRLLAWCNLEQIECADKIGRIDGPVFSHLRAVYAQGQRNAVFQGSVSFETYMFTLTALSYFYFANMKTMSQTLEMDLASPEVKESMLNEMLRQMSGGGE